MDNQQGSIPVKRMSASSMGSGSSGNKNLGRMGNRGRMSMIQSTKPNERDSSIPRLSGRKKHTGKYDRFVFVTEVSEWGWTKPLIILLMVVLFCLIGALYGTTRNWDTIETFYVLSGSLTTTGAGEFGFARHRLGNMTEETDVLFGIFITVTSSFVVIMMVYAVFERAKYYVQNRAIYRDYADVKMGLIQTYIETLHEETDHDAQIKSLWIWFFCSIAALLSFLSVGSGLFAWINCESWLRGFYLSTQILTTNSFGDVYPESDEATIFVCCYQFLVFFLCIPFLVFIVMLPGQISTLKDRKKVFEQFGEQLDENHFRELCADPLMNAIKAPALRNKAVIARCEFAIWCMISANLVDPDIVSGCFTAFDRLDYDETGKLTVRDTRPSQDLGYIQEDPHPDEH